MTTRIPRGLNRAIDLCQYNAPWFTETELEAIREYHRDVPNCLTHTPLDDLLTADDVAGALREHAERLANWHDALCRLLTDPRLERKATADTVLPVGMDPGSGPYSLAVRRFLTMAGTSYHSERQHFEYETTRWALGLQPPWTYPEETRALNLDLKSLTWD